MGWKRELERETKEWEGRETGGKRERRERGEKKEREMESEKGGGGGRGGREKKERERELASNAQSHAEMMRAKPNASI